MPMPAQKPATTPIPVQLSESDFNAFILPHLSMPWCGPKCKLGYHRLFNLILWLLYTGMQWKCLPVPKDHDGNPEIHYTTVYRAFASLDSHENENPEIPGQSWALGSKKDLTHGRGLSEKGPEFLGNTIMLTMNND